MGKAILAKRPRKGLQTPTYTTYTSPTSTAMPIFFPTTKMGRKYGKKIFARENKKRKVTIQQLSPDIQNGFFLPLCKATSLPVIMKKKKCTSTINEYRIYSCPVILYT